MRFRSQPGTIAESLGPVTETLGEGGHGALTLALRHPGRYRVYHNAPEPHVPNTSRTVRVRHVRR